MKRLPAWSTSQHVMLMSTVIISICGILILFMALNPLTQSTVVAQPVPDEGLASTQLSEPIQSASEVVPFVLQRAATTTPSQGEKYQLVYVGPRILPLTGIALSLNMNSAIPVSPNQLAKTQLVPKFSLEPTLIAQGWVPLLNQLDNDSLDQQTFALSFSAIRMSPQSTELAPNTVIATLQIPDDYTIAQLQPLSFTITTVSNDQQEATVEIQS